MAEAAERVEWYLNAYVRNASGFTPLTPVEMPSFGKGSPGSLDLKEWGYPSRPKSVFEDSLADYGRWIELWVDVARAVEASASGAGAKQDAAWVARTFGDQLRLLTSYTFVLHDAALKANRTAPAAGLIWGPAEHDTAEDSGPFFSINAWTWST